MLDKFGWFLMGRVGWSKRKDKPTRIYRVGSVLVNRDWNVQAFRWIVSLKWAEKHKQHSA